MAQSKSYVLSNPAGVAAKIAAAGGPQIDPTKPTGSATENTAVGPVTLEWEIAGPQIMVTIKSKPWELPASTIWEHVNALFE